MGVTQNINSLIKIIKHQLVWNTLIYTGSNAIRSALSLLLLPILTRFLSSADYGIIATFDVFVAILALFIGCSVNGAIAVNYFKMDRKEFQVYVGNAFLLILTTFGFFFLLMYSFRQTFAN